MILGQVICLLLISIVTSQDYTLENTQNLENSNELPININIDSQNEQLPIIPLNLESSEIKLQGQANDREDNEYKTPNRTQSDVDNFLTSIQNSDELKNALSNELRSFKERAAPGIETEQDFSQMENSMEDTALQAELKPFKQRRELSDRDVRSSDYKFSKNELNALKDLTDKLRSGVSFPISKSYMKILCKFCTKLSCRPKCVDDSHCHSQMACVDGSCIHICSERVICGKNTDCLMVNHRPVCKCKPGFTGNPNFFCKPTTGSISDQGCSSNHACKCSTSNECPGDLACVKGICIDLCLMRLQCGRDAVCRMVNHEAICKCKQGYTGDPLSFCYLAALESPSLCPPNSCGPNTICKIIDDRIACKCLPNYVGNPWRGCRIRCRRHNECRDNEACVDHICRSGCKLCGKNAICEGVNNHRPICKCPADHIGNPYKECVKKPECKTNADCPKHKPLCKNLECENPCGGSCGINALCIVQGDQGYCICPEFFYGNPHVLCTAPPCLHNSKCPGGLACINDTCLDICRRGPKCAKNARCRIMGNKAVCLCEPGFTGDPLISCKKVASPTRCSPNSCGPNAKCEIVGGKITCKCLPKHVGNPWRRCRPGCAQHDDCRENEACVTQACRSACRLCGMDAMCEGVKNHKPICKCPPGYGGNPHKKCNKPRECSKNSDCPKNKPVCTNFECENPCKNLCGTNALCRIIGNHGVCLCREFYFGDPNTECRPPPCLPGQKCPMNLACVNGVCLDLCSKNKKCGKNSVCRIQNNKPVCICYPGFTGDPLTNCRKIESPVFCPPNSCGPNTQCEVINEKAVCKCSPNYVGNPWKGCRRRCSNHYDCREKEACISGICQDGCKLCGKNSMCEELVANKPFCICRPGFTGDPYRICSQIGDCVKNSDCPSFKPICKDYKCQNPCQRACGIGAICHLKVDEAICSCPNGYTGDPLVKCKLLEQVCRVSKCGPNTRCILSASGKPICKCLPNFIGNPWQACVQKCNNSRECKKEEICMKGVCKNSCELCGYRAICRRVPWKKPICKCPPGFNGNPYKKCKSIGDCIISADCPPRKPLCKDFECRNPCLGACGIDARCRVEGVKAVCTCPTEFTGDPLVKCRRMNCRHDHKCRCTSDHDCPETLACVKQICIDVCLLGKKCGRNAICQMRQHKAICICKPGLTGDPLVNCEPPCYSQNDCPNNFACKNNVCVNICKKFQKCGKNAMCKVMNNNAVCLCGPGFTGNPFKYCKKIAPVKRCNKSPCGPNTICLSVNGKPVCKCLPNYVGNPWKGCLQSCKKHRDCKMTEICIRNICQDACRSCGIKAICQRVAWNEPICKCPVGYTGNPRKECRQIGDCITNVDCPPRKPVCKQFYCQNPCIGACGIDALCRIQGAKPLCTCPQEFTGDPLVKCKRINCRHEHECKCMVDHDCPEILSCVKGVCVDLCFLGKRCGKNAHCHMRQHKAVCECEPGFFGNPLIKCEPPCYSQKDCGPDLACKNKICVDLCRTFKKCGKNAFCKIIDNQPTCVCPPGFQGNPFKNCRTIQPVKYCDKSPCGPNAVCLIIRGKPFCRCLPNYYGHPWTGCSQRCRIHNECKMKEVCIDSICQDACTLCGKLAICERVPWHEPICRCPPGYTGNAYEGCKKIGDCITNADCPQRKPVCKKYRCQNPCIRACGIDALCRIKDSEAVCTCPAEYTGDPLIKCRRMNCRHEHQCKCTNDYDCPETLSCLRGICVDICLVGHRCGINAVCKMRKRKAICVCQPGLIGNPLDKCVPPCYSQEDCAPNMACINSRCVNLCKKKKCGRNSVCKIINNKAVCLCVPGFTGNPLIGCKKIEPVKVCPINRCGPNTRCSIIKNKTVCKCLPGFIGDPWKGCRKRCNSDSVCKIHEKCIQNICQDACKLCGVKAICQKIPMQRPICKCSPGYTGNPYKRCKLIGECITSAECPSSRPVCKNYKCLNPCHRACGIDALCRIEGVERVCTCPDGFTGDPLVKCRRMNCQHEHECKCTSDHDCPKTLSCVRGICVDLCLTGHKCGINAVCQMREHKVVCICEAGLTGDPLIKCVPPCYSQQDCSSNMACIDGRCVNLCKNKICGKNSVCKITNNKAVCLCLPSFTGNPLIRCSKIEPVKVCPINRCGPNTRCSIIKNKTVCKCLPGFVGDPWKGCRKRCKADSVCKVHEKCIQNICQDACRLCGVKAVCIKKPMQRPTCDCRPGYTGNPYKRCNLIGDCVTNSDCPSITPVCKNFKCLNPCHRACGVDAICRIEGVKPVCTCPDEFTGDPLVKCRRINCRHEHECKCTIDHDCPESLACVRGICVDVCLAGRKCGINAVCQMRKHKAICICEAGLTGDPLIKCIPPCYHQKDCSANMACIENRCVDLCRKKTCGKNSVCKIMNNKAVCFCLPGFTGNPLIRCSKIKPVKVCPINQCGPKTRCLIINNKTVCECLPGFVGDPWKGCRKRCNSDSVCKIHEKCIKNICQDACRLCGVKAVCQKIPMQRPICKCSSGFTGNPYKRCKLVGDCVTNADCPPLKPVCKKNKCLNPCHRACGVDAVCRVQGVDAICTCPPEFTGDPLEKCKRTNCSHTHNCRCSNDNDCPSTLSCVNGVCVDLCLTGKRCGKNALCEINQHKVVCTCKQGMTGDPLIICQEVRAEQPVCGHGDNCKCTVNNDCPDELECVGGTCLDSCLTGKKCGFNAVCVMQRHNALCQCKLGSTGDPLISCVKISGQTSCGHGDNCKCTVNNDCPDELECVRGICLDSCLTGKKCGFNAVCVMQRHNALCQCKLGSTGDPLISCVKILGQTICGHGDNCKCTVNNDCPDELECVGGICLDSCLTGKKCGFNAVCVMQRHNALCQCKLGSTGDPLISCVKISGQTSCGHGDNCKCTVNNDCPDELECVRGICLDSCLTGKKCGINAVCVMHRHNALCQCKLGSTGDPLISCVKISGQTSCGAGIVCKCSNDNDCPNNLACVRGVCLDLCLMGEKCGFDAVCVMQNHKSVCKCKPGLTGNPLLSCNELPTHTPCGPGDNCRCISNKDCPGDLACVKGICLDLCLMGKKCGLGAVCVMHNHDAVCKCQPGSTGDPLKSCTDSAVNAPSRCGPKSCGQNAVCETINNKPFCKCIPPFVGDPWVGCQSECQRDTDCSAQHACIANHCQHACNLCVENSFCEGAVDHRAVCKCLPGFTGDPHKFCMKERECIRNSDCPHMKPFCDKFQCKNPCDNACGINALCFVKELKPRCHCPKHYIGNPYTMCRPQACTPGNCKIRCKNNRQCPKNMACSNNICINLCSRRDTCGTNAVCKMVSHKAVCQCRPSFTGNPNKKCRQFNPVEICPQSSCGPNTLCLLINNKKVCICLSNAIGNPWQGCHPQCKRDHDCSNHHACIDGKCQNACKLCGIYYICTNVIQHRPICACPPNFSTECSLKPECVRNSDCPKMKPFCKNYKCENPCDDICGINALCDVGRWRPLCYCPLHYIGNPYVFCKPESCLHEHECKCLNNLECPEYLSCLNGICVDFCLLGKKCGENAICTMKYQKAICICEPGFLGNPNSGCKPIDLKPQCTDKDRCRCKYQQECPPSLACVKGICINVCFLGKKCGTNAFCKMVDHKAVCVCIPRHTGNPNKLCRPNQNKPQCSHEDRCRCRSHQECPTTLACVKGICLNVCLLGKKCGTNAFCKVIDHKTVCVCKPGHIGDAKRICRPNQDKPICATPNDRCSCIYHQDCPKNLACVKGICINICLLGKKCGSNAFCEVVDHKAVCVCEPGHIGDPNKICRDSQVRPTCTQNDRCPINLACVKGICINICLLGEKCGTNAFCKMFHHKAVCVCKPGHIGDPNKICRPNHVKPTCTHNDRCRCKSHHDCPTNLACIKGICIDVCSRGKKCGKNAFCRMLHHNALCLCKPGHIGDPNRLCRPNQIKPPCTHNDRCRCRSHHDCPTNLGCFKGICINVCLLGKKCGKNAFCEMVHHKAVCLCKPRHIGDPNKICRPNKVRPSCTRRCRCKSHHNCPTNLACIKGICMNVCLLGKKCGKNAFCGMVHHKPMCACKPGHIGDPNKICRPNQVKPHGCHHASHCKCRKHKNCLNNLACVRGVCVDLCLKGKKCGINALCVMQNHVAVCKCKPGLTGDPNRDCQQSTIQIGICLPGGNCKCINNVQCPAHLACVKGRCLDLCLTGVKCGRKALCRMHNHKPVCSCEVGYTGDPLRVCQHLPHQVTTLIVTKCFDNRHCPKHLSCVKGKCCDLCSLGHKCGFGAICRMHFHKAVCICPSGVTGNALNSCQPKYVVRTCPPRHRCSCTVNYDCPGHMACVNDVCVNLCLHSHQCGVKALCEMHNHKVVCKCGIGFTGNPLRICERMYVMIPHHIATGYKCSRNIQCSRHQACVRGCLPGLECKCKTDKQCPEHLACVKGICSDLCSLGTKCGKNAICSMQNNKVMCSCATGFTGDAFHFCTQIEIISACLPGRKCKCSNTVKCPTHLACVNGICVDLCTMGHKCGVRAVCTMQNHKPVCVCLPEFTGDPKVICQQTSPVTPCLPGIGCGPSCVSNVECPEQLDCERGICINKCTWKNRTRCAVNAVCVMKNHKPVCVCKEGFFGNPLRGCKQQNGTTCHPEFGCGTICVTNKQCPDHLTCKKGICIDTCLFNQKFGCAINAICVTKYHKPTCICKSGFTGDALVRCVEIKPVVACPPTMTCGSNAFCTMHLNDHICMCNHGYTGDPLTECQKTDELVDACSPSPCGSNTLCLTVDDKPYCKCLPKYVGNPSEGCYHSCEIDFDCTKKEACIEHECQSPCKLCGRNARCEGTKRHRPICKCPRGFIGNPYRECKTKSECAIHIDCPKSKPFCNKTRCINPCTSACGIGAKCNLVGIKAKCYCPRPLTGDPNKICVPAGISGLCRRKQCQANAKCEIQIKAYGQYVAVCKCLPGYHEHGNQCFLETCTADYQCVEHKACINSVCGDPCRNRCGPKTSCKTTNHKPICSCLPGFEGNPAIECVPQKVKPCVLLKICPKK